MRRIVVIFHRLGPYHCARLSAAAQNCHLLASELSAETSEYAWDKVSDRGAFRRVTLFEQGNSRRAPTALLRARLARTLQQYRPEVVAIPGWSDPGALLALEWCLVHRVPVVVMSESTAWDQRRVPWKEWMKSRIVRLCGAGLVGGRPHAEYLAALGMPRARIFTGYDVVDNAYFKAAAGEARKRDVEVRSRHGLPASYFLASARFLEKKNLPGLLEAYARYRGLNDGQAKWDLVLLGDGPLRPTVESERRRLGLEAHVLLAGFKQYADLPAYYGLAGAFVHASASEPWGLVVNEAMASGLPVLVSRRCGCAADLVREGVNGYLFEPRETERLGGLMQKVWRMPKAERHAMAVASERLIAPWGPERFADALPAAAEVASSGGGVRAGLLDRFVLGCAICERGMNGGVLSASAGTASSASHSIQKEYRDTEAGDRVATKDEKR